MTLVTSFRPEIINEVPKVTNSAVDLAVVSVIQDICEKTQCYKVALDDMYIIKGLTDYEIASPEQGTTISSLVSVAKDGYEFSDYTFDMITFRLLTTPSDNFKLRINAVIMPTRTATSVHGIFENQYYRHVVAGAKAMLMLQTSKPWSNPTLGMKYQADYDTKIAQIKIDLQKQYSNQKNLRVRFGGGI